MTRAIPYVLAILALLVSAGSAWSEGCSAQMLNAAQPASDAMKHELTATFAEGSVPPVLLAQSKQMMQRQDTELRLKGRVPRGKRYAIQRANRRGFDIMAPGTTLPQIDCVKIECPAGFEKDVVCWECHESLTSE